MKKSLLLLAVVALVSTTATVSTANNQKFQNAVTIGPSVPEEVSATFHSMMTNIMQVNFPSNPNYDANGVNWDKVKQEWQSTGRVNQVNGSGWVEVVMGRFDNQGNFIEFFYNVHQ